MLTYSSSFKAKPKTGSELATHYATHVPNEQPRKTINVSNVPQKVTHLGIQEKTYRKVITEAN